MSLQDTISTAGAVLRALPHLRALLPGSGADPSRLLEGWARRRPTGLALAFGDERYTWRDADERANRWAAWLGQQGVGQGDVVALMMDNRPDFLFALHGLCKRGAVAALLNTNLAGGPLEHAIRVSGAGRVIAGAEHREASAAALRALDGLDPEERLHVVDDPEAGGEREALSAALDAMEGRPQGDDRSPGLDDPFCYIYTSGTTGLPKAAIISNRRMLLAGIGFGHLMHRSGTDDVIYVPLPLYHSSAMFLGWGAALGTGAAVALRRRFSASRFWSDVRRHGATSFLYIGELCRYLMNTPVQEGERDHQLRVGVGNGMRPDVWEAFQERFGVPLIREFYGATEGNVVTLNLTGRPGMIGKANPGQIVVRCDTATGEALRDESGHCTQVAEGETGLLLGRINAVSRFDGYVDEEATSRKVLENVQKDGDRYFNTGDLVTLHEDRWLSFADRVGDTFRWKGENVSTNEVADVLDTLPGVLEANVYGVRVPHADGRAGMAAIRCSDDFSLDVFAAGVGERLPGYQRPLFLRLLGGEMQITGTFKHRKVDYREERFDPHQIGDPLFVWTGSQYAPLDDERFDAIQKGTWTPS